MGLGIYDTVGKVPIYSPNCSYDTVSKQSSSTVECSSLTERKYHVTNHSLIHSR